MQNVIGFACALILGCANAGVASPLIFGFEAATSDGKKLEGIFGYDVTAPDTDPDARRGAFSAESFISMRAVGGDFDGFEFSRTGSAARTSNFPSIPDASFQIDIGDFSTINLRNDGILTGAGDGMPFSFDIDGATSQGFNLTPFDGGVFAGFYEFTSVHPISTTLSFDFTAEGADGIVEGVFGYDLIVADTDATEGRGLYPGSAFMRGSVVSGDLLGNTFDLSGAALTLPEDLFALNFGGEDLGGRSAISFRVDADPFESEDLPVTLLPLDTFASSSLFLRSGDWSARSAFFDLTAVTPRATPIPDLPPRSDEDVTPVPLPASGYALLAAFFAFFWVRRRRSVAPPIGREMEPVT